MLVGGCLCGAVRYRVTASPSVTVNCHCSMCRRQSGAAFLTYFTVDTEAFLIESGELRRHRSSEGAERSHCGTCGSPLTFIFDAAPDRVWVTVGTLDTPAEVKPSQDWYVDDKIEWTVRDGGLEAFRGAPD